MLGDIDADPSLGAILSFQGPITDSIPRPGVRVLSFVKWSRHQPVILNAFIHVLERERVLVLAH